MGVLFAQVAAEDAQGMPEQAQGFGRAALFAQNHAQIVEREGRVGMIGAEDLLFDRDRAAKERFGFTGVALGIADVGQVVER